MKDWKASRNYRRVRDKNGNVISNIITVDGIDVEVTEEVFNAYSTMERNERYQDEAKANAGFLSLEQMNEDELKLEYLCSVMVESSEDRFISSLNDAERQRLARQLPDALGILSSEEANIVNLHFYKGISIRQIARMRGTSHQAMSKRMETILRKIKNYF